MDHGAARQIAGPFGPASLQRSMDTECLIEQYRTKCGADVSQTFQGVGYIHQYLCERTGVRFWRPASVAGDERFYRELSECWPNYYQTWRWEYDRARDLVPKKASVLEIGCGRGYFLQSLEGKACKAIGLEMNKDAITRKVTKFEIRNQRIHDFVRETSDTFDVVCHFQLLEHIPDPKIFLQDCMSFLGKGGLLIFSVPNFEHLVHRTYQDPFDLPPHHMSQFTPESIARLARELGLDLIEIAVMPNWEDIGTFQSRVQKRIVDLIHRLLPAEAPKHQGNRREDPGHTLLAVLRRQQ